MRELRSGLWHWTARHPDWEEGQEWDPDVSSYAVDDGERLLLFDPLGVPGELERLAGRRDTAIVLTAPWHERDTESLVQRLGVQVFAPRPDTAEDLMEKYGITAEQAGDGSPDLAWLRSGKAGQAQWYSAGDVLPSGIETFAGREPNDTVLRVASHHAVISGDTLADFGRGLEIVPAGSVRASRASRWRQACVVFSTGESSTCSLRTGRPPTGPRSSAR